MMRTFSICVLIAIALTVPGHAAAALLDELWDGRFGPAYGSSQNGTPSDSAIFTTLSDGTNVYVGGQFTSLDGISLTNVAQWDGTAWHDMGGGLDGPVKSISFYGGKIVAGGSFGHAGTTELSNIAQWDGQSWSPLDAGISTGDSSDDPSYGVNALATIGSDLFAAGRFGHAGGLAANNIARWDGGSWHPLAMIYTNYILFLPQIRTNNGINGPVYALSVQDGGLIAGGSFLQNTGVRVVAPLITLPVYGTNLVRWDGVNWSGLNWAAASYFGQAGAVRSLAVYDTHLVAGGTFSHANGDPFDGVALRDGNTWKPMGQGIAGGVQSLLPLGTNLYAAGYFASADGAVANSAAIWNGSSWAAAAQSKGGDNDPTEINTLAADSYGTIYAGGLFTQLDVAHVQNLAKLGQGGWQGLAGGLVQNQGSGAGYSMVHYAGQTIVGGAFQSAGGVSAANIAAWNGVGWSSLGNGLKGSVSALAVNGSLLYAGGNFSIPDDPSGANVAVWDGGRWSALSGGVDRPVHALEVFNGNLYIGGEFKTAGQIHAEGIARWDGSNWQNAGSPQSLGLGKVYALKTIGAQLYVGGLFGHNAPGNSIAIWDGTSWAALGGGITSRVYASVYALATDGTRLFVGGSFDTAGGIPAANLAVWDGSSWTQIGAPNGIVFSLLFAGNKLYAGGAFQSGFGVSANTISQWDGQAWSALGSGTGNAGGSGAFVEALLADNHNLFVAGNFSLAGAQSSAGFGIYHLPDSGGQTGPPVAPKILAAAASSSMLLQVSGDAGGYVLEASDSLDSTTGWSTIASLTGATNVTIGTDGARRFFRLRK